MTEREALLRAVCELPDDDTPRLVFADWLQEHGEEARAGFIRLQILMAQIEKNANDNWPQWQRYCAREQELRQAHDETWWAQLVEREGYKFGKLFVRGFVETVFVSDWAECVRNADSIFWATPLRLGVFECAVPFTHAAAIEFLSRFRAVDLRNQELTEADAVVLTSPALKNLQSLTVWQRSNDTIIQHMVASRLRPRFGDIYHRWR